MIDTVPAITIRREIAVPAADLFDAWLDPELIAEWMRPGSFGKSVVRIDAREGGKFEIRMQDPTGKKYLDFHQKLLSGRGSVDKARAMAVAKEVGLDMGKLEKDLASAEVKNTLEENFKLAEAMGMNGTPSYVIGKQVVIGAVGVDSLKEKIGIARCGKATC